MIIRSSEANPIRVEGSRPRKEVRIGELCGLKAIGVNIVHLEPGQESSERHWHLNSDEFCLVLSGQVVLRANDGEHTLTAGDSVCWPAGEENGHSLRNDQDEVVMLLVVGTNPAVDEVRYPDSKQTLFHGPTSWRLVDDSGNVLNEGKLPDG